MPRTFDCATLFIIGHALPLSTITRAALATPHCADAGTHTDAPSAVSQTDSLQSHASSCNDRLCLTLISATPLHHKAALFVLSRQPLFLSSTTGPFLRPDLPHSTAPRAEAVKTGRRPPPQAAQRGLDGREHGATLNQVGSARFLSRHTTRNGWLTDLLPAELPPAALLACHNGRKSHHPLLPISARYRMDRRRPNAVARAIRSAQLNTTAISVNIGCPICFLWR